jgi:hypothetical protein
MAQTPSASAAEVTGFPLSRPLVNGRKIGSFFPILQEAFVATTDTPITINLGRLPSGYIQVRTPPGGGQITDGANAGSDWDPSTIVLQATIAGTYGLLIF